ncbi:MAG TPA: pyridoxamine 5'-phosphate oxidase family protein [Candidatus Sulfotelmatobacter sp.]|jgi:nitroimidazol reductase NimA-like FMN-containing flavoprotein (pyridoxamine 5'-phosphate oxidase superfamily)|nr:pyridoxamine 5'-phosphate oxidase family protein [Candidatus Sulfotelmatobacter sp.]
MLQNTARTAPRTKSDRMSYDRDVAYEILDQALVCHVGFVTDGTPVVIPTIHWRVGDHLYFHGSHGSRMAKTMAAGQDLCVTVTLLDGLVMARSAFNHSMNFRSVVLFGQAEEISDFAEKSAIFDALMEKVAPGRLPHLRPMHDKEVNATKLLSLTIDEGSVKSRKGPPGDPEEDRSWPVWAGVLPLSQTAGEPVVDVHVPPGVTAGKP